MPALPPLLKISLGLEKMSSFGIDDPSPLVLKRTSSVGMEGLNLTGIGEDSDVGAGVFKGR